MNLNTSDYWDEQFEKEWKLINTVGLANPSSGYRWDGMRFEIIGNKVSFTGKLLDIGCGLGNFCRFIKARNPFLKIYGVDFSSKAIEIAERLEPSIIYKIGEATKLPFPDNYFTTITAQEIIEHLDNPGKALKEWKRVLKPGGKLFITTPWKGLKSKELVSEEHVQEWTPEEFSKLVAKYFKGGEFVIPPSLVDRVNPRLDNVCWFLLICIK